MDAPLIPAKTVAANLQCSMQTVYRLVAAGKIPFVKVGQQYRFDWDAVKASLAAPTPSWSQPKRSTSRKRVA
ncbi:excisionase family DNA-binding protein [Microbacterium enclense]|uniref:excisionase family DNA-binding protein n=1 Tax=Microbacterium enclense TaxID=993073 RepID=UPI00343CBFE9